MYTMYTEHVVEHEVHACCTHSLSAVTDHEISHIKIIISGEVTFEGVHTGDEME